MSELFQCVSEENSIATSLKISESLLSAQIGGSFDDFIDEVNRVVGRSRRNERNRPLTDECH